MKFLQDEELDIRQVAATVACRAYAQSRTLQSSLAVEIVWTHVAGLATFGDAITLLEGILLDLGQSKQPATS